MLEPAGPWSYVSIAIWGRALNACRLAVIGAKSADTHAGAAERLRTVRHCVESVTQAMDELFYVDPPGLFGACFQLTYLQGIVDGYPKQLLTIERRENELKQQRKRLRKEHDIAANKIAKLKKTQESE